MNSIEAADFPKEWLRTGEEADRYEGDIADSREKYETLKKAQEELDAKKKEQ